MKLAFLISVLVALTMSYPTHTIVVTTDASILAVNTGAEIRTASWYGEADSCHYEGCPMANGEPYDEDVITCASRTYYGETLKIEFGGKSIICLVTDKIAKWLDKERVDLSKAAFSELADLNKGLIEVKVSILE